MARARRDLPVPGADAEADAAADLLALTRFCVASEPGSEAEAISTAIRERAERLTGTTNEERLIELRVFVDALGAGDGAERWITSQRAMRKRVLGADVR